MDDFPEDHPDEQERDENGRPIVRHVVRDLAAAVKMRKVQAQADERARRAESKAQAGARRMEAQAELARIKAEDRRRTRELKAEMARLRIGTSAIEKARTNIAISTPLLIALLIGGFVAAIGSGRISPEATSTSATLLTLVCTSLLANLRSVVTGKMDDDTNGNGNGKPKPPAPKPPARKDTGKQ